MRRGVIALALVATAAASSRAGVEVTVGERGLDVRAARVPLAEVLDGLARQTKMKVVYEGSRPHALVTVELKERTPAQAVLGVLEGLGLNYALVMNAAGTEVETLIFPSASGGGAAGGGGTGTAPVSPRRSTSSSRSREHVPDEQPDTMIEMPEEIEMRAPEPHDVVPDPPKPSPPGTIAPLNPTTAFPISPFAPSAPASPVPSPTPAPAATPSPNIS